MKNDAIYESHISTARWLVYDVPGNVGWIMYLVCLIQCFVQRPEFLEIPLVLISLVIGILPAVAMVVGIAELISERTGLLTIYMYQRASLHRPLIQWPRSISG
jgi:hypothetical protein